MVPIVSFLMKERNWARLVSGIFIGVFITNVALIFASAELQKFIQISHNEFIARAVVAVVLGYMFLIYAAGAVRARRAGRRRK